MAYLIRVPVFDQDLKDGDGEKVLDELFSGEFDHETSKVFRLSEEADINPDWMKDNRFSDV